MAQQISYYELSQITAAQRERLTRRAEDELGEYLAQTQQIIAEVRDRGDEALVDFASRFDQAKLSKDQLRVSDEEFAAAEQQLEPEIKATLEFAADSIRAFHIRQMPSCDWLHEFRPGVFAGERVTPIDSVACYVPRGKGSFPSVALMTSIPAAVAGVPQIVLLTPPDHTGQADPATLYAARLGGSHMVIKAGGAQAVAAAAYGTASVPKCLKFEGPGSPWIAAARRLLADRIVSRLPAGPSESIVFADSTANPKLAALDLLIEAEHGSDSSALLVTCEASLARDAMEAVTSFMEKMDTPYRNYAADVLGGDSGGIVLADDLSQAYDFINEYAPEHLQIMSTQPEQHLQHISNAAEILLGQWTPSSIANYLLGPSNVLPTARAAKVHSPLGVHDFLKRHSIMRVDEQGYQQLAEHTGRFARYEGFSAHANAVSLLRKEIADE